MEEFCTEASCATTFAPAASYQPAVWPPPAVPTKPAEPDEETAAAKPMDIPVSMERPKFFAADFSNADIKNTEETVAECFKNLSTFEASRQHKPKT